jgi:hypothetical protein
VKLLALTCALLLTSCGHTLELTPAAQIWRDAYCHGEVVAPGDQERVERWAESNGIECQ